MKVKNYDFAGYVTRNDVLCSDGRIIRRNAFKHMDGQRVPLVWQHKYSSVSNVLGHVDLENREDGMYGFCSLNETDNGRAAKEAVKHGDISAFSIFANGLKEAGNNVLHGNIKEVSLVLAGANPEAFIETDTISHDDGSMDILEEGEFVVKFENQKMDYLKHEDDSNAKNSSNETVKEVFQRAMSKLDETEQDVIYAIIGAASKGVEHSDFDYDDYEEEEEDVMKHNLFENDETIEGGVLSHSELNEFVRVSVEDAVQNKASLRDSFLYHAQDYGIENIDVLFPEAKLLDNPPSWISEDMEWVSDVLGSTKHSPFSRIKSQYANITEDDARARGYIKGNQKKEEVFPILSRVTTPTTIYKKQKLDRDDIVDITSFDVVSWIKAEMRVKLNEELARAILIGDGRNILSEDKINEENIRPVYSDSRLFTLRKRIANQSEMTDKQFADNVVKAVLESRKDYKGKGTPAFYCAPGTLTRFMLAQDLNGRRIYETESSVLNALRVSKIVEVTPMEDISKDGYDLLGIVVNLGDYNVGADKGGDINLFDDFDIDYNQYKYLLETRCSGALVTPYSAVVIEMSQTQSQIDAVVEPMGPTETIFDTNVSDIQENVIINSKRFRGTSKFLEDSSSPIVTEWGEGNFVALKFTAPDGAVVKAGLDPSSGSGLVELDDDMNGVWKISDQYTQSFVVETTVDGVTSRKEYNLTSLRCKKQ